MEATKFGEAEETERYEIPVSDRRAEKEIGCVIRRVGAGWLRADANALTVFRRSENILATYDPDDPPNPSARVFS